ncbi:hypothetical protein [Selenomonas sp. AB3002]|uniref:hypothetical protein n=1 Tax=Selenomonas sp. AB3002 TaxID=1392502 RepID=UPI0004958AD1
MATYRDIFDTRDRLNPKIVERLRKYGNLEPPGIYGRPYNGGAKHGQEYPLSRANYLRLVTMQDDEHRYKDPRWVWQETARKNGWKLKPTARAAQLEVYRRGEDGKSVPELWTFYNVEDFKNYPYEPLEVKGDRPEDFRQAIGILKDNGIDISWKAGSEQIFAAVKQYAKERGEDEFSAPMTAHLFLKTNYLSYDYEKNPLYTEAQLKKLEYNTKIIFAAIKRAQNLYDKLESIQEKVQRQEQAVTEAARGKEFEPKVPEVARNGLFQDLYVDFAWSETPIRNEKGEPYKEGIHLNGEDAYKFLAAFNALDKEVFNDKLRGFMGYNKVKMAISYGKYHETEYRIRELGKLNFKNEASLARGLERHFNAYRISLIEMPELRQSLLRKNQGLTDEHIVENCQEANEFCSREMQKMRAEENLYLEMHPEIQAINAQKADTFIYVVKKEDFKRMPSAYILSAQLEESAELQVAEKSGDYHVFREGMGIKADEVAFESSRPISAMKDSRMPVYMALGVEDQVAFVNMLGKLKLEVTNTGPIMEGHAPSKMKYWGMSAIDELARLKQRDLEAARLVNDWGFIDRKVVEQQHLVLSYDGKNLTEITFEEGCGRLTGEALGLRQVAEENPEIKAVLSCAVKMKGGADSPEIRALVNDEQVTLPSFEERRDKVLAAKPNSHALNRDWYRYYEKAALQDLTAATKEEVMAGMVKIMEKDGLRPVKIANIARTNPGFKNDLLPVKVYGASKSKSAGGEKSASTARDAGKHAGQNLTMEEQANRAAREATKKEQKDLIKVAAKEAQKKKLSPKESLLQGIEGGKGQERKMEMGK